MVEQARDEHGAQTHDGQRQQRLPTRALAPQQLASDPDQGHLEVRQHSAETRSDLLDGMVIGQQVEGEECACADGQDSLAAGAWTKAAVLATRQEEQEGQGVQAAEDRRGRRRDARIAKEDARERDAAGAEQGR
jgi:hypothetical protein